MRKVEDGLSYTDSWLFTSPKIFVYIQSLCYFYQLFIYARFLKIYIVNYILFFSISCLCIVGY